MILNSSLNVLDAFSVFLLTIFFITIIIKYADKIGLVDVPNQRSSHQVPIPKGAGLAMYISYMTVLTFFHFDFLLNNYGFFIAQFLILLIGVIDDFKDASPKIKFLFIIVSTCIIFFFNNLSIDYLGEWGNYRLELHWILSFIVTIFAVVGFTNALNLIDGLDGLAGLVSLIIFCSFLFIGYEYNDVFITTISCLMIFCLLAFLLFNWNPAYIFMGDSGSLVLGFTIASVSIKAIEYVSIISILFLTALPIIDTLIVMTRRMQRGESPFSADKSHIHHKIISIKGKVDVTVLLLVLIQVAFSIIGVLLRKESDIINLVLYILMLFLFFTLLDPRKQARKRLMITTLRKNIIDKLSNKIFNKNKMISYAGFIALILFASKIYL